MEMAAEISVIYLRKEKKKKKRLFWIADCWSQEEVQEAHTKNKALSLNNLEIKNNDHLCSHKPAYRQKVT